MRWCFDTSALIEPWVRLYSPDVFPPIWAKLEELAANGVIAAPHDVRLELEKQSDPLSEWAAGLDGFFVEANRDAMECFAEIVNGYPGFMKVNSTKSGADPFVVAMAEVNNVPVVTYETAAKQNSAPKIPNVCASRNIQVVSLIDVLRAEGFKL